MKTKIKIIVGILLLLANYLMGYSYAATGSFSIVADSSNITVGDTTKLKVTATNCGGKFSIKSSDSNIVSVSSSSEWIESATSSFTLTAKKVGKATIIVEAIEVSDTSEKEVKGSKEIEIVVKEKSQSSESKTAIITSLVVGGKTYKNPKKDLTITVDSNTSNIKIVPTISNGESYTISNSSNNTVKLETGTNKITIKLASGATYILRIQRLEEEKKVEPNVQDEKEDEKKQEEEKEEKIVLKSLKVIGFSLTPEFSSETYSYALTIDKEHSEMDKLEIEAVGEKEEYKVEMTGNENLVVGENIISILVKSADESKTTTYEIIATKVSPEAMLTSASVEEIPQEVSLPRWNSTQKILITIFTSIITIAGITFAIIEYRYGKQKEEDIENSIPYAKLGFETENEESREKVEKTEILETKEVEGEKGEAKHRVEKQKKKGKHF